MEKRPVWAPSASISGRGEGTHQYTSRLSDISCRDTPVYFTSLRCIVPGHTSIRHVSQMYRAGTHQYTSRLLEISRRNTPVYFTSLRCIVPGHNSILHVSKMHRAGTHQYTSRLLEISRQDTPVYLTSLGRIAPSSKWMRTMVCLPVSL